MSNNQKKQLTPVQQEYQKLQKQREIKRPVVKNCIMILSPQGRQCKKPTSQK